MVFVGLMVNKNWIDSINIRLRLEIKVLVVLLLVFEKLRPVTHGLKKCNADMTDSKTRNSRQNNEQVVLVDMFIYSVFIQF